MTRRIKRPQITCGPLTATLWAVCAAGWLCLLLTDQSTHMEALYLATALLAGMMACTRIAIDTQARMNEDVSEEVSDSLDQFQRADELTADRALNIFMRRFAESGLIVTEAARPPAGMDDPRLWRPTAYYDSGTLATVVPITQARRNAS
jgi:hypothetical protein